MTRYDWHFRAGPWSVEQVRYAAWRGAITYCEVCQRYGYATAREAWGMVGPGRTCGRRCVWRGVHR